MYQPRTSIYICMMLGDQGSALAAEVIQATSLATAIDRAGELLMLTSMPSRPLGYELWNRGRKLVSWSEQAAAA